MNEFLRSNHQIEKARAFLDAFGWIRHGTPWKDWDLSLVCPLLRDGNLLDMGCYCSWVLPNAVRRGIAGEKWGIDLHPDIIKNPLPGCQYKVVDLCDTGFESQHFSIITCLSVIEHCVDFELFLRESSRLLRPGGLLLVTFDYWPSRWPDLPPIWKPLCREDVERLIDLAKANNLTLRLPMDWTIQDGPLFGDWWYPVKNVVYTFGAIEFVRGES